MKCVFVVLHYCLYDVTKDCITSLLSLRGDKEIVVVDNASPDDSGKELQKLYTNTDNVHIILNSSNLGFAAGNNIGYNYAKTHLSPDVIIVLNNDTIIQDDNFLDKLFKLYCINEYHIVGPDILTYKGYHQNPFRMKGLELYQIKKKYLRARIKKIVYSIPYLYKLVSTNNKGVTEEKEWCKHSAENVVLHGSAIIFTSKWIKNEEFAFYPGTFMYFEEDLLYSYARSKGYLTFYEPSLQILHLEDMSTNASLKGERKKTLFQTIHKINSLKVLLDFNILTSKNHEEKDNNQC